MTNGAEWRGDEPRVVLISATFKADTDDDTGETVPPVSRPWNWLYSGNVPAGLRAVVGDDEWPDPEPDEYGLEMTVYPVSLEAVVTADEWRAIAATWDIVSAESEANMGILTAAIDGLPRAVPGFRWNFDGMGWNTGGWTPVLEVTVSASATADEVRANPRHFSYAGEGSADA